MLQIKTNPVFKEIVFKCWEKAGGNSETEKIEIEQYQVIIRETARELYNAELTNDEVIYLWNQMREFELTSSERFAFGKCKFVIFNPYKFEWELSKKAQYKWLRSESKAEIPKTPAVPVDISKKELAKAYQRLKEFRYSIEKLLEEEAEKIEKGLEVWGGRAEILQKAKEPYQEILALLEEKLNCLQQLQKLEEEKLAILRGGEESEEKPTV